MDTFQLIIQGKNPQNTHVHSVCSMQLQTKPGAGKKFHSRCNWYHIQFQPKPSEKWDCWQLKGHTQLRSGPMRTWLVPRSHSAPCKPFLPLCVGLEPASCRLSHLALVFAWYYSSQPRWESTGEHCREAAKQERKLTTEKRKG